MNWKSVKSSIFPPGPSGEISYDKESSLSYVTPHVHSMKIIRTIVSLHGGKFINVIESNGGLGGDTITFAKHVKVSSVVSIELDDERFKSLVHNVSLYKKISGKVKLYNDNFIDWFIRNKRKVEKKNTCLFVDPPWGGADYKQKKKIDDLYMMDNSGTLYGMMDIVNLVSKYFTMVIIKLPYNFNMDIFNRSLKEYYLMEIKKMLIIFIERR